jgi:dTDP-4-amino-4,6-dideoxygalactose transaminase
VEIELDLRLKDKMPEKYLKRMTPWQARLALTQLTHLESDRQNRLAKAKLYFDGLKNINGLVLPPEENFLGNAFMVFPVQYADRKKLLKYLMAHNRDIAAQHLKNCADLPAFSAHYRDCPVARKTAVEVLLLPTYPRYPIDEVKENVVVIKNFCQI